jgi:hypothetical protein
MLSRRPIQLPPPGRNDCGPGGRRGTIPYHTTQLVSKAVRTSICSKDGHCPDIPKSASASDVCTVVDSDSPLLNLRQSAIRKMAQHHPDVHDAPPAHLARAPGLFPCVTPARALARMVSLACSLARTGSCWRADECLGRWVLCFWVGRTTASAPPAPLGRAPGLFPCVPPCTCPCPHGITRLHSRAHCWRMSVWGDGYCASGEGAPPRAPTAHLSRAHGGGIGGGWLGSVGISQSTVRSLSDGRHMGGGHVPTGRLWQKCKVAGSAAASSSAAASIACLCKAEQKKAGPVTADNGP